MGVVCVFQYPVPEGKTGPQIIDALQKQAELLGAVKVGNFTVECETYQSNVQAQPGLLVPQRTVNVFHDSEHPASCFAILDSGTCLVADSQLDSLVQKLKGIYNPRKGQRIESRGQLYEYVDFVLKFGSVTMGPNFRGVLVEAEYCPCVVPADCWNLLKEFMTALFGSSLDFPCAHLKQRMEYVYTPADTVQQYLEHFNNFRKSVSAGNTVSPIR